MLFAMPSKIGNIEKDVWTGVKENCATVGFL